MKRLKSLAEITQQVILRRLDLFDGHQLKTAKSLGITDRGLRGWLKRYRDAGFTLFVVRDKKNK